METSRPQFEILTAYAVRPDEVASSETPYIQKKAHPNRMGFLLLLMPTLDAEFSTNSLAETGTKA